MISLEKLSTAPEKGIGKKYAEKEILRYKEELYILQNKLYAEKKHGLLIVLQGMDGSGKDGTIRHVFSSVNPMGCNVRSFKTPTEEEASHDYLWRAHAHTPAKGMIQIFNRSYYEDIIFPTVHKTIDKRILDKRYDQINGFEKYLCANDIVILKFYLHISKKEQKNRLKERVADPNKKWKYNKDDLKEAKRWDEYMDVYRRIINRSGSDIPWIITPADEKWYRNYFVAKKIVKTLKGLNMKYPNLPSEDDNEDS